MIVFHAPAVWVKAGPIGMALILGECATRLLWSGSQPTPETMSRRLPFGFTRDAYELLPALFNRLEVVNRHHKRSHIGTWIDADLGLVSLDSFDAYNLAAQQPLEHTGDPASLESFTLRRPFLNTRRDE